MTAMLPKSNLQKSSLPKFVTDRERAERKLDIAENELSRIVNMETTLQNILLILEGWRREKVNHIYKIKNQMN